MAAKQFQLPKINTNKPPVPVRNAAPPLPGRQPTRVVSSPTIERSQRSIGKIPKDHRFSVDMYVPNRVVDIPTRKKALLNLDKKDVDEALLQTKDIAKLVTEKVLPLIVVLKQSDTFSGSSLTLPKGLQLHLHFLHKTTRIYATDPLGNDVYLPLIARQQYTVLPIDPVHDDKLYPTTEALINSKPLPRRVRIEEAHFSDHPGEAQEVGDIIEITGIEKRPVPCDSDSFPQNCLIGTCNDVPIAFSESMDCASYSTMPSVDFMSLSEVVKKFPIPLRIRRADKPDNVMILHRMDEEYHVIATCTKFDHVFSIPISWDGKLELLENAPTGDLLRTLLSPLYPLVNATWDVREPGRRDLQPSMQLVAQPHKEVLDPWSRTKEGQDFVLRATKTAVDTYKLRIEELMEEKTRLNNELQLYRLSKPPAPLPRELKSPLLPPKPSSPRSPPPNPNRCIDDDEDAYEEPMMTTEKGKLHVPSSTQLEELKHLLQERERKVSHLHEKHERLKLENKDLDNKNASLVEDIRKLQTQIDKLEAAGDPMYDSLDSNEYAYPATGPIYSQGGGGGVALIEGIKTYNIDAVAGLLREMKLEKHVSKFKENCINGELLCDLDEEDLYGEVGMGRIQAKRLILEVRKRNKKP